MTKEQLLDLTAYLGIKGNREFLEKRSDEIMEEYEKQRKKTEGYKNDKDIFTKALLIIAFKL